MMDAGIICKKGFIKNVEQISIGTDGVLISTGYNTCITVIFYFNHTITLG